MRLVSRTHAACSRFIVACDRQTAWVGGRRGQAEEVSDLPTDCLTLALFILKLVVAGRGGVGVFVGLFVGFFVEVVGFFVEVVGFFVGGV